MAGVKKLEHALCLKLRGKKRGKRLTTAILSAKITQTSKDAPLQCVLAVFYYPIFRKEVDYNVSFKKRLQYSFMAVIIIL